MRDNQYNNSANSVSSGNIIFANKVDNLEAGYFIKREKDGTAAYLRSYISTVLSYMQHKFPNNPGYHPVPKEKIVIQEQSNGK